MSTKQVYEAKKAYDEAGEKFIQASTKLWETIKKEYYGKYILYNFDDEYVGIVYIRECSNLEITGKILYKDGKISNWANFSLNELLEDYEICSLDKAVSLFSHLEGIEKILEIDLKDLT